jgi:hypothetical protein
MSEKSKEFECTSAEISTYAGGQAWVINWSGNIGFGQLYVHYDKDRCKLACDNEFINKDAIKKIFNRLIDDSMYLTDFYVEDDVRGRWVKHEEILSKEDAEVIVTKTISRELDILNEDYIKVEDKIAIVTTVRGPESKTEEAIYELRTFSDALTPEEIQERSFDLFFVVLGAQDTSIKCLDDVAQVKRIYWKAEEEERHRPLEADRQQ